jgi:voltage-gated potassium channel
MSDAAPAADARPHAELGPYQLFMFALGVYVLLALGAQTFLNLSPSTNAIIDHLDDLICLIFFGDFFVSLWRAPSKLGYLKWGWIDLVSCIPMVDMLRVGRIARIVRILRAFRGIRAARFVADYLLHYRADGAFFSMGLISLVLLASSSIAILQFEKAPESNIRTPQDALWWAYTTMTTVGYGDRYPVTPEGRMLAAVLMTAGVGIFGSFTGLIASWILTPTKKDHEQDSELSDLRDQVTAIQRQLDKGAPTPSPLNRPDPEEIAPLIAAWPALPEHVKQRILADIAGCGKKAA